MTNSSPDRSDYRKQNIQFLMDACEDKGYQVLLWLNEHTENLYFRVLDKNGKYVSKEEPVKKDEYIDEAARRLSERLLKDNKIEIRPEQD